MQKLKVKPSSSPSPSPSSPKSSFSSVATTKTVSNSKWRICCTHLIFSIRYAVFGIRLLESFVTLIFLLLLLFLVRYYFRYVHIFSMLLRSTSVMEKMFESEMEFFQFRNFSLLVIEVTSNVGRPYFTILFRIYLQIA